jgi:hypothetical protein
MRFDYVEIEGICGGQLLVHLPNLGDLTLAPPLEQFIVRSPSCIQFNSYVHFDKSDQP